MTIQHHPSDEALLGYANGALAAALSLVVGAHLDACVVCRNTVALAESLGGRFLESLPPIEMSTDALQIALGRLDAVIDDSEIAAATPPKRPIVLPSTLQHLAIGSRRWLAPGIWTRTILKDRAQGTRIYLLGAAAGHALPRHGHQGTEMTQVLEGNFFDGELRYGAGDFLEVGSGHEHRLVVGPDQECVCVIASEGAP